MTIREKIKPFVIVDFAEGASLQLYSVEDYKQELFDSRKDEGFTGNGYDWTRLAEHFIAEKCPQIAKEIQFDPDYSMFTVYADSAELLENFAADFKAALDDDDFIYPFFLQLDSGRENAPAFRPMRRKNQQLSAEETEDILRAGTSGVLALAGDNGYPYAVPMSYVYSGGKIYFHCAKEGHKLDSMLRCGKASFCVIAEDNIVPEKYTTYYKSVIAFGRISFAETLSELTEGARLLAEKYCRGYDEDSFLRELENSMGRLCIPVLDIEHLTGKAAIELIK